MASEEQAASRPIHRKSVPLPESAVTGLLRAIDKRWRNNRPSVQQPQPVIAFLGQAIERDFVRRQAAFRFGPANRRRHAITPMCAREPRLARMEFPAVGLWHLPRERCRS